MRSNLGLGLRVPSSPSTTRSVRVSLTSTYTSFPEGAGMGSEASFGPGKGIETRIIFERFRRRSGEPLEGLPDASSASQITVASRPTTSTL